MMASYPPGSTFYIYAWFPLRGVEKFTRDTYKEAQALCDTLTKAGGCYKVTIKDFAGDLLFIITSVE